MAIWRLLKNVKSVALFENPNLMTPVNFTIFKIKFVSNMYIVWHQSISRKECLNLIFGGNFYIWPNPVYCQRGRWTFKSKAASTRFFPTDSLRIFSALLTVWKNVWSDSGFPAFFHSKALGFHFLAIQHCNWNQFNSCNFEFPRISNSSDGFTNFL